MEDETLGREWQDAAFYSDEAAVYAREGMCACGHYPGLHILLPGHPSGAVECQALNCDCGKIRLG